MPSPVQPNSQGVDKIKTGARVDFLLVGVFICLILCLLGSSYAWQSYQKTAKHAETALKNTGERLSLYVSLSFSQIDMALNKTSEILREKTDELLANPAQPMEEISNLFSGIQQIHQINIHDVSGKTLLSRNLDESSVLQYINPDVIEPKINDSTLKSFFIHSEQKGDLIFAHPAGQIGAYPIGGISAVLKTDYLNDIFNAGVKIQDYGYILAEPDKILYSYPADFILQSHRIYSGKEQFFSQLMIGNRQYYVVTTPVKGFDLSILIFQDMEVIFEDWKTQTTAYAAIALIFSALLLGGAYRLRRNVGDLHDEVLTRRKAEDSLQVLSKAVEQSPASVVITDRNSNITYVNAKFTETTGYVLDEVIGQNPRILSSGVEQVADYSEMWSNILNGKEWHGEFHNKRKDGTLYWERAIIRAIHDENNQINHFLAIKEDITEKKDAADQLKLTGAVFETASEAIMVSDHLNRVIMVNSSFTDITGYNSEEIVGQTPSLLNSGRHDTSFFADMFNSLKKTGQWQGEIWNRRKNGEIYPQWLSIKTILDDQGKIERYISLFNDITKRKQDEERILYQANYDALTGLPNRSLFMDRLERALVSCDRTKSKIALMFLDLDRFKNVNDTLGHAAGDALLLEAAKRLKSTVRKTDTVARLGGDEFTIILNDLMDELQTKNLLEKLLTNLSAPYKIGKDQAFVSASIGITIFPDDAKNLEDLLKNADAAMYRAKENGRNMSHFFTQEMNEKANERRALEASLYQALEREEFVVHYQPIVDPLSGNLHGCEALLRWMHPEHGFVSPATFIPLAEETGQIVPIGEWAIKNVFREAKLWEKYTDAPPRVAVNLSSIQFKRANASDLVADALVETGLSPHRSTIEITESLLVEDDDLIMDQLNKIRNMGVGLSIDDFGTGYSSLSYLKKFPITTLKIDRSFISDMTSEPDSDNIVDAILSMAYSLKLKVVAEGVETFEQRMALVEKNCNFIQGYYFSPPIPVAAFRELIKKKQPLKPDNAA